MVWLLLIPVFISLSIGSYYTYSDMKNSSSYLFVFIISSLMNSYIWVYSSRKLNEGMMIFYSLIWDALMVLVYYLIPIIIKSNKLGWQALCAAICTILSLIWLKKSLS